MAERGLGSAPDLAIGAPFNIGLTGPQPLGLSPVSVTPAGAPAV